MAPHPTVVHAAADFHRQALLREVITDQRAAQTRVVPQGVGLGRAWRRMVACVAGAISRVIDDFEPGAAHPRTTATERWMRP
jgi:hypothetical protein